MIQTSRFIGTLALLLAVSAPLAQEVNVYSYRQPFLIEPVLDAFTDSTGIKVNMVYAKKGLIQRLESEGANSPADLMLTADIGLLLDAKEKGLTQAMSSSVLSNRIPAEFRDSEEHWYGLTSRARIIVASKDRVQPGEIANYEDLTDSKWKGRICTRSGKHPYMVLLIASMVANNGKEQAGEWVKGIKANLARKPQGNDRAQVKAIKEGVCDVAIINHYYMAEDAGQRRADPMGAIGQCSVSESGQPRHSHEHQRRGADRQLAEPGSRAATGRVHGQRMMRSKSMRKPIPNFQWSLALRSRRFWIHGDRSKRTRSPCRLLPDFEKKPLFSLTRPYMISS